MVIINMGMYVNDHGLKIGLTRMYQIFDQRKDVGNTIKFCLLEKVEESISMNQEIDIVIL